MDDHSHPSTRTIADIATDLATDLTCDVAVVGGGLAGSLLALVLARRGLSATVIDLHDPYPHQFRCERFSSQQVTALKALGVADVFSDAELNGQGLRYDRMINALRAQWPTMGGAKVSFVRAKVTGAIAGRQQTLTLHDGRRVASRLCVLATGLNEKLRHDLGLKRTVLSEDHSVCVGFNLVRNGRHAADLDDFVHPGERPGDGVGHASLFRMGDVTRVNLFVYDTPKSARVEAFRHDPLSALLNLMPGLRGRLAQMRASGDVDIRVTDLYTVDAAAVEGIVPIGDARRTSCPASGTGVSRILNDVRVIADRFAPNWLAGRSSVFAADPSVRLLDDKWHRLSVDGRQRALNTSIAWRVQRLVHQLQTAMHIPARNAATRKRLTAGDVVRVRPAVEILATLDMEGALNGIPFLPEMAALTGQELPVLRRAVRSGDTVLLDTAPCNRPMVWKNAWLADPKAPVSQVDAAERTARQALRALAARHGDAVQAAGSASST